jgi:hypothetical protein
MVVWFHYVAPYELVQLNRSGIADYVPCLTGPSDCMRKELEKQNITCEYK